MAHKRDEDDDEHEEDEEEDHPKSKSKRKRKEEDVATKAPPSWDQKFRGAMKNVLVGVFLAGLTALILIIGFVWLKSAIVGGTAQNPFDQRQTYRTPPVVNTLTDVNGRKWEDLGKNNVSCAGKQRGVTFKCNSPTGFCMCPEK